MLELWRKEPFCTRLSSCSFKRVEASVEQLAEATGTENTASSPHCNPNVTDNPNAKSSLLWMKGKIAHQLLDMFLDCGTSVSCISKQCVAASPSLKQLQQSVYTGPGLVGVNGRPLKVLYKVWAPVVIGNPAISLQVLFAIIEDLPYSCIIGLDFLSQLKCWGMDNQQGYLKLNDSVTPVFSEPQFNGHMLVSRTFSMSLILSMTL